MTTYSHQYSILRCPDCSADLTAPDSVDIDGADNNGIPTGWHYKTHLDSDGYLMPDSSGILESGFHAGTACANCGQAIDDYEVLP